MYMDWNCLYSLAHCQLHTVLIELLAQASMTQMLLVKHRQRQMLDLQPSGASKQLMQRWQHSALQRYKLSR